MKLERKRCRLNATRRYSMFGETIGEALLMHDGKWC